MVKLIITSMGDDASLTKLPEKVWKLFAMSVMTIHSGGQAPRQAWLKEKFSVFTDLLISPTASLILLDNRLTEGPAAGTAWQDENQSARETNSQGGDGIRYVAL